MVRLRTCRLESELELGLMLLMICPRFPPENLQNLRTHLVLHDDELTLVHLHETSTCTYCKDICKVMKEFPSQI